MRRVVSTISLCASAALASAALLPAQGTNAEHQLGGFINAVWLEPRPSIGPDAFSVWTAEDGSRIRRYDSWTDSYEFEEVVAFEPQTLHDIYLHQFASDGVESIFGLAVGTGGQAVWWETTSTHIWIPFATDPAPGLELWACAVEHTTKATVIWVAGENATLRYSKNIGVTWQDVNLIDAPAPGSTFTSMDFADFDLPGRSALAGNNKGEIFYSSDGVNWRKSSFTSPPNPQQLPVIVWDIDFRPDSTTEAIAVGGLFEGNGPGYPFRTTDGGLTWSHVFTQFEATGFVPAPSNMQLPGNACSGVPGLIRGTNNHVHHATLYGVHMFENGQAIFVAYAGQVWKYFPSTGTTFDYLDNFEFTTAPLWGCHGDGVDTVFISGQFGNIRKSEDVGETWEAETPKLTWRLHDVAFPTPDIGYVVGQSVRIIKTTDGGDTWDEQFAFHSTANLGKALLSVAAHDASSVVAVGETLIGPPRPAVMMTNNGGATCWNEIDLTAQNPAWGSLLLEQVAVSGLDPVSQLPEYWICGRRDASWESLLRSTDGGQTWTRVDGLGGNFDALGIDFLSRDVAMVVGAAVSGAGRAYLTFDATSATPTWVDVSPAAINIGPLDAVEVTGGGAYAVGAGGTILSYDPAMGLFVTAPGSAGLTPNDLHAVEIRGDGGPARWVYVAGDHGVVFRQLIGTMSWEPIMSGMTDDVRGFDMLSAGPGFLQVWLCGKHARWGDSTIITLR